MNIKIISSCLNCGNDCSHEGQHICDSCSSKNKPQGSNKRTPKAPKDDFSPFIAIKIETSGLPDKGEAEILEVAMIYGDYGATNPDSRPRLNFYIKNPVIHWQPEAKEKVGYIEEKILNKEFPVCTIEEAKVEMEKFFKKCLKLSGGWKNILVGRNMYSLIIPMLKKHGLYFDDLIDHAALDLTSLFYFQMKGRATTQQILRKYDVEMPDQSAAEEVVAILSVMYEEVGKITGKSTISWY